MKLENCIVCQRATIEDRADLKDCEVGGQFEVLADRESPFVSFHVCFFCRVRRLIDSKLS